jgi:hypothetical protein
MTELREDLDLALRSVPISEAPVQRAIRDGRRLRNRRRLTVLAGVLAVAAVAAASPSLARLSTAPALSVTRPTGTPLPSATATVRRDPVVTDQPPSAGAAPGTVAQGTIGGLRWTAVVSRSKLKPQDQAYTCFTTFTAPAASGPASQPTAELTGVCAQTAALLASYTGSNPAGFNGGIGSVGAAGTPEQVMLGAAAPDVAYFELAFTDGQQLKLIPVTVLGRRYIAWVAPASMSVASLTAHLGGPNADSGQTSTAIPYDPSGGTPLFGLWLKPGQATPPRASGVIGQGTADGRPWSESAYEGPWGTCFDPPPAGGATCASTSRLVTTAVLGGWAGDPAGASVGSAAPGVARLRITFSDGTSVQVTPVALGNERLFAFWIGKDVVVTGWTAYDAAGGVTGTVSAGLVR